MPDVCLAFGPMAGFVYEAGCGSDQDADLLGEVGCRQGQVDVRLIGDVPDHDRCREVLHHQGIDYIGTAAAIAVDELAERPQHSRSAGVDLPYRLRKRPGALLAPSMGTEPFACPKGTTVCVC